MIVELDGSQHYTQEMLAYDNARTDFLEKQGYVVIRFSNQDTMKHFRAVCEAIDNTVKTRMQG